MRLRIDIRLFLVQGRFVLMKGSILDSLSSLSGRTHTVAERWGMCATCVVTQHISFWSGVTPQYTLKGRRMYVWCRFQVPSISWENRALVECHNNGLDDQDGYFSKNNNIPCVCLLLLQLKSNISTVANVDLYALFHSRRIIFNNWKDFFLRLI